MNDTLGPHDLKHNLIWIVMRGESDTFDTFVFEIASTIFDNAFGKT